MADKFDETRQRVAETIETLEAGLDRLTEPSQRYDFTEKVLKEFAS